jgi:Ca2+-dependent lipid-binding protein
MVVAYAKFGKPLYYTRTIYEDLNPVYEETIAVLLTIDEINSEESLSLMLWDADSWLIFPWLLVFLLFVMASDAVTTRRH